MTIELKQAAQQAVDAFDAFGDADDFASLFELTQKMRALSTALQQAEAQQPATAIACGIPGMAKTTCPYCEQGFAFEHEQPATGEPVKAAPYNPTEEMRWAMKRIDPALSSDQCRALWSAAWSASPSTHPAPSVFLVRDVASLLGASVPDVCNALAELGYEPRRSTNAAISPDEAIAVAKRINPAPSVPDDVMRDAERYRFIRDADVSDDLIPDIALYAMESLDEYIDAAMLAAKDPK